MEALYAAKRRIEDGLCRALNLTMVQVPLIVDRESGVNDYLDRDGSRTPVTFHISNDRDLHPLEAEVVQAATKWKRMALRAVRVAAGRGAAHRHARGPQGLLPRPRPQRLRRPVGLGAGDRAEGPDARLPHRGRQGDLGRPQGHRGVPARALPGARRPPFSAPGRADVPARRGHPRGVSRPSAQAAGDGDPPGAPGRLHLRDRLAARRRPSARVARLRLRRLVDRDALRGRPADARAERRHPRLESGHPAPARADVEAGSG